MSRCLCLLIIVTLSGLSCKSIDKEIQEFTNFLEKTAGPEDPIMNDHNQSEDDGTDPQEDEPIKDAWIYSGKFEGDLILNKRQRTLIAEDVAEGLSRNGLNDVTKRWPNNEVIYYIQKKHFDDDQIQAIEEGMENIAKSSCLKFRPYQKGDSDALVIQGARRGCFAAVGYQSGYQVLNLSARHPVGRGCFRHGTVVHEMLHAVGFFHMQSSPDRDDYININWDNIIEGAKHNFRKYNQFSVTDFGVPYDYDSVLHYSTKAFSKNGGKTIVPKESGVRIGQRRGMSDSDVMKLNKMYCSDSSDEQHNTIGTTNQDETTIETSTEKKKVKKKKATGSKPFIGSGLGYSRGQSVIIKFPEEEEYDLTDTTELQDSKSNPKEEIEIVKAVKNSNKKKDKKPKEKKNTTPKINTNFATTEPKEKKNTKPEINTSFATTDYKIPKYPDYTKDDDFFKKISSFVPHTSYDDFKANFPTYKTMDKYDSYVPDHYFDDFDTKLSQGSQISNAYSLPSFLKFKLPLHIKDYWDKVSFF